jgi:hypothetical protein
MFYTTLDSFLGIQLASLVNSVSVQCTKHASISSESSPRYLYFNKLNLAYKSTIRSDHKRFSNVVVTSEVLKIITDINNDTSRFVL